MVQPSGENDFVCPAGRYDIVVTDTATGRVKTYHNPAGTLASVADTRAF